MGFTHIVFTIPRFILLTQEHGKIFPRNLHLLYIATFKAERLSVGEFNKNSLMLTSDYSTDWADDEIEYDFLFK